MNTDELYMKRCLQLARLGSGNAAPNPMVGSVIVHKGRIIGEGYHRKCGGPHAEVNAVESVENQNLLKESTLYVNLEPCAHYGKTPPCSKLIIDKKIPEVVIGCIDSFSEVSGKGIKMLTDVGVKVRVGTLEKESRFLNRRFFHFHAHKKPYIILKWAQTMDGFIDVKRNEDEYGQPTWITNEYARMLVHKWRNDEMAIMVGTKTAIKDNPSLTLRHWSGTNPVRVLLDRNLRVSGKARILDSRVKTIIFNRKENKKRTNLEFVKIDFSGDILPQILDYLYQREIQSLIVEGGRLLLQSFIDTNSWDEARVFIGDTFFEVGVDAPRINLTPEKIEEFGQNRLEVFYRRNF